LARQLAEQSSVLLKNEGGLLPLKGVKSIAVIGPNAAEARIGGGGSSYLEPPYRVSPLEGLQKRLGDGVALHYEQGCDNHIDLPLLSGELLSTPDGTRQGLLTEFYAGGAIAGAPTATRIDRQIDYWWTPIPEGIDGRAYAARWSGVLKAPAGGRHAFRLDTTGGARLLLDGTLLLEVAAEPKGDVWSVANETAYAELEAGRSHRLVVEYTKPAATDHSLLNLRFAAAPQIDDRIERAAALAARCDTAVIFAGMPRGFESEGGGRPHMRLPGRQDELIAAVARANPRTVVVLNVGSPVEMPWIDAVPAALLSYYPGQEGGNAAARLLVGDVAPSGKLSVSYPVRYEDNPSFVNYPGGREVRYGEGVFVGYRYYDAKGVAPLFPFGHGLSYTTFAYSDFTAPTEAMIGEPVVVSVKVTNTGAVTGQEVVQLYVADEQASVARPPKELKGFAKVSLAPGESQAVSFTLHERAFAFYDAHAGAWTVEPGAFGILVGASSRDIRVQGKVELRAGCCCCGR
jgi:beta-glucosidase